MIGVFGQQPFGLGNTDQAIIGTDEHQGRECCPGTFLMCQQRCSPLSLIFDDDFRKRLAWRSTQSLG
jgi:hypothetical protein